MNQNYINAFELSEGEIKREQASFISKVYGWMSVALIVTGLISIYVANSEQLVELVFSNRLVFYGMLIGELLLVGYLTAAIQSMSAATAKIIFLIYAVLNGVTMAFIFMLYTAESIGSTFLITAGTFAVMSAYGYFTKRDLTSMGNLMRMALIGLIIATVVNIFLNSTILYWATTYIGVLIFVGLVAYDTQKIKALYDPNAGYENVNKGTIMGALSLYLDFINLFLFLLRIFGRRK